MKLCHACDTKKPLDQFHKNKRAKDGLASQCKPCSYATQQRSKKKNWAKHMTRKLERERMQKYGLTTEDFEAMVEAQSGRCAICLVEFPATPHVDHDHETGRVRGLLCNHCNLGLGYFGDDSARLTAAANYLS